MAKHWHSSAIAASAEKNQIQLGAITCQIISFILQAGPVKTMNSAETEDLYV